MADIFSKKKRSEIMSKVRSKDTDIELILRKALHAKGYRYRLNYGIYGKPDIVFPKQKLAIFCDGDFWHGKDYLKEKRVYSTFWQEKISNNRKRDRKVNRELNKLGWKVLRFWKTDIKRNKQSCIAKIVIAIS